ncbi:MAG: Na/Pi cotransporter family protein [Spirochaetaceae bacterium]|jgi:phosphate:Na+ symporter|nr:Na/Pi cotransporter family protein [Spirochaetaceae bacterium]
MVLAVFEKLLLILGSLCLFLYGMKVMSDGIQQTAGSRLQAILGFMTGNRISAVFTGVSVTAIIQSSSATTVMVVSFANAGLLTLRQAIGVIMGANIGTTVTAWIVSLVGFQMNITVLALPAVGIGFLWRAIKWKHRELGNMIMGFGLLFLGLSFLTQSLPKIDAANLHFLDGFTGPDFGSELIALAVGVVLTLLLHSSSASTAIIITMALNGYIGFHFGAAMILGANIGTTVDAALASIGTKTNAKRTALVHVLFNIFGSVWAVFLLNPIVDIVQVISPGGENAPVAVHMAMFHTIFNVMNTLLFLPFVDPFAKLVSFIIKDKPEDAELKAYKLPYLSGSQDTPELSIVRVQKEIRDMAALVFSMYRGLSRTIKSITEETVHSLIEDLKRKEDYADQMREELTSFLMECMRRQLNRRSEHNVGLLLRIIADLEEMTDDCYSISLLLERGIRKNQIFKQDETEALSPYMVQVEEFLAFVGDHLGGKLSREQSQYAKKIEDDIDESRDKLRKLGRKRIEAGENVKTELLFIDFVRRIERLGDYCNGISIALANME